MENVIRVEIRIPESLHSFLKERCAMMGYSMNSAILGILSTEKIRAERRTARPVDAEEEARP